MTHGEQSQWFEHAGKVIKLDGYLHVLKVTRTEVMKPAPHTVIHVHAVPMQTRSRYYKAMRARVGHDWVRDVLGSGRAVTLSVMLQVGWRGELWRENAAEGRQGDDV